ncbi:MAG TPA: M23 family metallopeptidase [Candidatus Polarisedimenticolia bacterium]|jgi:murein DD-endopeptidase MepM/ murein hydrolase activator NlpD
MKRPGRLAGALLVILSAGLIGTAAPRAATSPVADRTQVWHVVKRGETLYSIARAYHVPLQRISSANGIMNPARIRAGMRLAIPGARALPPSPPRPLPLSRNHRPVPPGSGPSRAPAPAAPAAQRSWLTAPLPWPVEGPVISSFMRPRRGHRHAGIDIKSDEGTPVRAVADGVVTTVKESYGNYGRLVVIEHENGMVSYYGHNRENLVVPGQVVMAEDVIARVGRSGNATCDHLHFELHEGGRAIDPLDALAAPAPGPGREPARAATSRRGKRAPDAASHR